MRFLLVVLSLGLLAVRPPAQTLPTGQGQAQAGAAVVDITPPSRYPTGGHGPAGKVSRGRWGSLTATAFYFRDARSPARSLLLISTELFGVTTALHQAVAEQAGLPLESVVIAATHTHHGFGNFLSAELYNTFGSQRSGYDADLRAFLVTKLVDVSRRAMADAAQHDDSRVETLSGILPHTLMRNRSPRVFMRDRNHEAILDRYGAGIAADPATCQALRDPEEPEDAWDLPGCPRLRAANRRVTLVRIRRANRTAATAVFIGIHPTAIPARTPLNSPDIFGIARAALERELQSPIVAFFNGAEGDVVSRRRARDAADVVNMGSLLAREIAAVASEATPVFAPMDHVDARIWFAKAGDSAADVSGGIHRLATSPLAGWPMLGGAEGDKTFLYEIVKSIRRKHPEGEHGVKMPGSRLLAQVEDYPQALPFSLIRLGPLTLATAPFELSTATGYRVERALGLEPPSLLIVGLANEYASYTATDDEYEAQDYMGASTIWGPAQADFTAWALRELAAAGPAQKGVPAVDAPGTARSVRDAPEKHDETDGLEALLGRAVDLDRIPSFRWCGPDDTLNDAPARIALVGDNGYTAAEMELVTVVTRRAGAGVERVSLWISPLWSPPPNGRYRFRVTLDGGVIESEWFSLAAPRHRSHRCEAAGQV